MGQDEWKTPAGRLREAGAREILRLHAEEWTLDLIATQVGVSITSVWNVVHGKTWGWLRSSGDDGQVKGDAGKPA
jgi:hypothetical protein